MAVIHGNIVRGCNGAMDSKLEGQVISYDLEKRFGFIKIKGRPEHLFVHGNQLFDTGVPSLSTGDIVKCEEAPGRSGRSCAINVEIVSKANKAAA